MANAAVSSRKASASAAVVLAFAMVTVAFLAAPVSALVPYGRPGGGLFDLMPLLDDPFRVLEQSPSSVSRGSLVDSSAPVALARCDWKETPEAHVISVDVPGVRREDVKVEVEDNSRVLRISGERRADEENKEGERWHRAERAAGRFWRRFRMPAGADVDRVSARLENGVLTVTVPKVAGHRGREPRIISIAGGDDVGGAQAGEVKPSNAEM